MLKFIYNLFLNKSEIIEKNIKDIEFGDIILVRFPFIVSPVAWLIQKVFREKFAHAAIYLGDNCLFEATPKGMVYNSLSSYKFCKVAVLRLHDPFTCNEMSDIISEVSMLYKPGMNIKGMICKLWNLFSVKLGHERDTAKTFDITLPDNLFCSKLVAYLLRNKDLTNLNYKNVICSDFLKFPTLKVVKSDVAL